MDRIRDINEKIFATFRLRLIPLKRWLGNNGFQRMWITLEICNQDSSLVKFVFLTRERSILRLQPADARKVRGFSFTRNAVLLRTALLFSYLPMLQSTEE